MTLGKALLLLLIFVRIPATAFTLPLQHRQSYQPRGADLNGCCNHVTAASATATTRNRYRECKLGRAEVGTHGAFG